MLSAFFGDWTDVIASPWSSIALVALAIGCGAIVGAEREAKEKSAGLRTMILVSLGAAIFTRLSMTIGDGQGDPGRIAAQIVTGVGFLGAGTILHGASGVRGITTAATIWSVAAVGMVVGAGYGGAGLALSLTVLMILTVVNTIERRYLGPCRKTSARMVFDPRGGKTEVRVCEILDDYRIPRESRRSESLQSGMTRLQFTYCNAHRHHREFMSQLARLPEVQEMGQDAE